MPAVDTYRVLAERSWSWAMAQVASDDAGLWLPEHTDQTEPGDQPHGMHSGIGGLAHVLSEIRLTRPWTDDESALATGIAETLTARIHELTERLVSLEGQADDIHAAVVDRLRSAGVLP